VSHRIARRIASILWAPLLVLAAACGDENPTGPSSTLTGTWALVSVNGSAVPLAIVESADTKVEVLSGSVALRTGSRFAARVTSRETVGGVPRTLNLDLVGRFVPSGNSLRVTLTGETAASRTVSFSDGISLMTLVEGGVSYEFRRSSIAPPTEG
jgi:hypothetical protein